MLPARRSRGVKRISGAWPVTIGAAGHLPVVEQPAVPTGVVEDFLKGLGAP